MKLRHFFSFVFILALLHSCNHQSLSLNYPAKSEDNLHLNTLLTLNIGKNEIVVRDYVLSSQEIDSVTSDEVYVELSENKDNLLVRVAEETSHFFTLFLWKKGVPYAIPCKKSDKISYVFRFDPHGKRYKRVQIAGQMNDWAPNLSPDLNLNKDGIYEAELRLSPGTYLYQMALDGDWNHDPNNPNKVDNGYGKYNSILQVAGNIDKYPKLFTAEIEGGTRFTFITENPISQITAFWQNYLLPQEFITIDDKTVTVIVPKEANELERSFIRIWASNGYGVSNDLLIPLQEGKVLTKKSEIERTDLHNQIIYALMVDRFKNGTTENDKPLNRPDVHPKVDYMGGDIVGMEQVMEEGYFDKLGVNTLWVSPLNQNPKKPYGYYAPKKTKFSSYHGYWPVSSTQVDKRFGTKEELKSFVDKAHQRSINVLLDYVSHHVHKEHPMYRSHPEYFTSLYLPDGSLNTERWNDHRLTTWFDTFVPTFDMSNPTVVDLMTDSAMYWLNEFDLDGFRHDACKHVPETFWRKLTYKIKESDKNIYQIGETYGSPDLISSYVNTGMLNGQFDFNVFEDANTTFAGVGVPNLQRLNRVLQSSLRSYGSHNLMGNISGNHDKPRFMALASRDLSFGEDSKLAGWKRHISVSDPIAYKRLALMQTFILTVPGIPVIYYGDEIGMTGANDPDCRRMMRFDRLNENQKELFEKTATLTHLRKDNPTFVYGDFISLQVTENSWVYARSYFDQQAIVVINNSPYEKQFVVTIPRVLNSHFSTALFNTKFNLKEHILTITLPAYSSEVLL